MNCKTVTGGVLMNIEYYEKTMQKIYKQKPF